jgi:hypothetical protein
MRIFGLIALLLFTLGGSVTRAQEEPKTAAPAEQQGALTPVPATPAASDSDTNDADVKKSLTVYVSDFELDTVTGRDDKGAPTLAPASATQAEALRYDDTPAALASRIVDYMSATLVKELEAAGYTVHRLRPGQALPTEGIRIKGVFAEPDKDNHLRRAVIGNTNTMEKMSLFVGVGNLAKPDQPLYAVVDLKGGYNVENKPGAMINVSMYAPVARFEVPKTPTEKDVKDTSSEIVSELTNFLDTNVAAVTQ